MIYQFLLVFVSLAVFAEAKTAKPLNDIYCPTTGTAFYCYPGNASLYYYCESGVSYTGDCGTLYWNQDKHTCDYVRLTDCSSGICNGQPLGAYVRDPLDCSAYYECVGDPKHFFCPPETYWNIFLDICDYKENVPCP